MNPDRALMRFEFIEAIVRMALRKFYMGRAKAAESQAHAVEMFLDKFLKGHPFDAIGANGDAYRRERVYRKEVSEVLSKYRLMLRALHQTYARPFSMAGARRIERPADVLVDIGKEPTDSSKVTYMSMWGWLEMLEDIEFIDEDFSRREAILCFLWSRLRTSMDTVPSKYTQATHLIFEDFLEAICRMSDLKTLPADPDVDVVDWYIATPMGDRLLERRPSAHWLHPKTKPLAGKLDRLLRVMWHQFDALVGNMDGSFTPADLVVVQRRHLAGRR